MLNYILYLFLFSSPSGSISANELANVAIGGIPIGILKRLTISLMILTQLTPSYVNYKGMETAIKLIRIFDIDKNGTIGILHPPPPKVLCRLQHSLISIIILLQTFTSMHRSTRYICISILCL